MPPHTDSHIMHNTLRALQLPADLAYRGAILAVAVLLLLTAFL